MNTDRELLELAATAAGYTDAEFQEFDGMEIRHGFPSGVWSAKKYEQTNSGYWNPLWDDGDALKLATELNLVLTPGDEECCAEFCNMGNGEYCINRCEVKVQPDRGIDKQSAMRRAIVHAAAEIGRAMPDKTHLHIG
jgi:hypothetical protein